MGTDEKGKIPPSGLFLRDLADLRMPVAVRDMQALTGLKLGTVDVVITLGQGRKEAPTGIPLREPQHLRNPGPSSRKPTPAPTETRMSNALGSITITDLESIVERPVLELRKNLKSLRTRGIMGTQPESFSGRQHGYWSRSQGPRRRLARAPVRAHDLSNLKPTIALSGSDFAVPTHYLQQKPPPSHPKLIVRLPLPSPSPTKAKSQRRSGSFSRPPAEDDEADRDFAPPTPKRQGSSGRRGRGQNWRFGLSRDPSSPSGWSSRPGSSAHTPSQTQPSPATQQAAASALIPSPSHAASAGNPKRKNTRMTADAAITRQPSLPPAAVFKTVPPSRKAPVPAMEPSTLSAHSRKDSGSVSLATRSRTSSPDKSSRALTKALTSATSTGPATPAAITYPAPPHPSLLKLNTCISSQPGFKTPTVPASRTQSRAPTPASTRRSTPASTRPATPSALIPEVDVPDTSQHCVITYKPGMVRQIRSERGGWFTEEEVLVGVRFIVCA